jgi:hypothetical protein
VDQVLRNTAESLRVTFTIDGVPTDADGPVTVTVTSDDGTALATDSTASQVTTGVYAYSLAPQPDLDLLTLVWSGAFNGFPAQVTTYAEVVGGFYFSLQELIAMPNIGQRFTTAQLVAARQWFESLAESYCGQAFVPRYRRRLYSGRGTDTLLLEPNTYFLRSVVDNDGTAFTEEQLVTINLLPTGEAILTDGMVWAVGNRNIEVAYECGFFTCPEDIHSAALDAVRFKLLDDQGRREYSVQTELGIIRMSTPGPNRPTGAPSVDEALVRRRMPVMA